MASDSDHARFIEQLGEAHDRRIVGALSSLEDRLAELIGQAPLKQGALFDLEWAVAARKDISAAIQSEYLTESSRIVNEYTQAATSAGTMLNQYGDFVGVSDDVIRALKSQSFQGFQDIAGTFLNEIATEVYQNTISGRSAAESVKAIRQKINGVYAQSDQVEIQRLVNIANAGGAAATEAISKLHSVYAADKLGNNMRRYSSQMVHDSLMQFDASVVTKTGFDSGADAWKYYGSNINDTRDWCRQHAGKVYTEDEIRELWTQNWAGKASGDPFIVRGGYNCRHHWRPVFTELEDVPVEDQGIPSTQVDDSLVKNTFNSTFSTDKKFKQDDFNAILATIPNAGSQIEKVATFVKDKNIKTVFVKANEMSIKGQSSRRIKEDVIDFLKAGRSTEGAKEVMMSGLYNFSTRGSSRCNGFTSSSFEHIVVKAKTGANFSRKGIESIGVDMKTKISEALATSDVSKAWSFSSVQDTVEAQMLTTTMHELGHQVHYYAGRPAKPDFIKTLTKYSGTNAEEFHAETFVAWAMDRENLAKIDPAIAVYFDDLMDKALKNNVKTHKFASL